ncbi:hypothetical protein FB480_11084 [Agrobacterium vitis]|nr:hypothetical protein FB480_11084 [Agrobacterium vitis]
MSSQGRKAADHGGVKGIRLWTKAVGFNKHDLLMETVRLWTILGFIPDVMLGLVPSI